MKRQSKAKRDPIDIIKAAESAADDIRLITDGLVDLSVPTVADFKNGEGNVRIGVAVALEPISIGDDPEEFDLDLKYHVIAELRNACSIVVEAIADLARNERLAYRIAKGRVAERPVAQAGK